MKKRLLAALLILLLLPAPAALAKNAIPRELRFSQKAEQTALREGVSVKKLYPVTCLDSVNGEMRGVIDRMAEAMQGSLPRRGAYLDVGASIFRTGPQWMSFLTVGRMVQDKKQLAVDCDARVYDMVTGDRVTLDDLFALDSPAWQVLAEETRRQLRDYFAEIEPDQKRLDALCEKDALRQAGLTLTPAKLSLHYRAGELYPGKATLMHVDVFYPQLREYMTERAQRMTDSSCYRLIALTYDDGPARGLSMNVMNKLRLYGASATFFLIGAIMGNNDDVVCREHDAGHTVASHNYFHVYDGITKEKAKAWRERFDQRLDALIGRRASIMRAPGGLNKNFIRAECGLPIIHWSGAAQDAPGGGLSASAIANHARNNTRDGAVLLMHDANKYSADYTEGLLKTLEDRNFLCVTVEELYSAYGVKLEPNQAYGGCEAQAKALEQQ